MRILRFNTPDAGFCFENRAAQVGLPKPRLEVETSSRSTELSWNKDQMGKFA
jgi:hypothetical protein